MYCTASAQETNVERKKKKEKEKGKKGLLINGKETRVQNNRTANEWKRNNNGYSKVVDLQNLFQM